jgi:membrane protease YdiL (CAAX protease family)
VFALLEFASTLPLRVSNCTKSLAFRRKVSRRCVDLERLDTVNNMRMSTPRQRVITYIAFVVAFALAADYAAPKAGSNASAFVVMWTPALAALAAGVLTRRSLGAIGWRLWPAKWLLAGWIIPILYAFPAYALVWLVGLGSVPSPTFLERARFTLGMPSEANWLVIVSAFGYIALVNLPPNMILTLGEEIGWRGFLVPELTTWVGFRRASLYSGVIWGAWHLLGFSPAPMAHPYIEGTQLVCQRSW